MGGATKSTGRTCATWAEDGRPGCRASWKELVTISKMSTTPTMADVGKHAGVGIGTVSRVLNGSVHVSDATRKKVPRVRRAAGLSANA